MAVKTVQLGSFCGGTSKLLDSAFMGMEQSINMWPETVEATDSYTKKMLKGLEGFESVGSILADDRIIAIKHLSNEMVFRPDQSVSSAILILLENGAPYVIGKDAEGDYIARNMHFVGVGTADTWANEVDTHPVTIAETAGDPAYCVICRGDHLYYFSLSDIYGNVAMMKTPTSYVTNEDVIPTSVTVLNYRLVLSEKDSDYIYWSELNNPNGENDDKAFYQLLTRYAYTKSSGGQVVKRVTFDDNQFYPPAVGTYDQGSLQSEEQWLGALNNVKVDFRADTVRMLCGLDSCFIALGARSMQTYKWQNSVNCPYISTNNVSSIGLSSAGSLCKVIDRAVFVGGGEVGGYGVYATDGFSTEKLSSRSIDQRLNRVKEIEKSKAFYYARDGHTFYVLTFFGDEDNFSVCYDFTEKEWHDRVTMDGNGNYNHWDVACCEMDGNEVLMASFEKKIPTNIYRLTNSRYTDHNDNAIPRERTTGIKFDGFNDIIVRSLELVTNNGAPTEAGVDPSVMLQVSLDGGFTWSNEQWVKSGRAGRYNFRTMWRNLGKGPKIAFRVKVTDNVPFDIATAQLEYSPCGNRIG